MIKQLFSEKTVKKAGIIIATAYVSCSKNQAQTIKGFFTIGAESPLTITKFFVRMTIEM